MQIALDTLVYLLLSLALFSLVVAMLPKIEEFSYSLLNRGMSKQAFMDKLVEAYLNNESFSAITSQDISQKEVRDYLEELGIEDKYELNFNTSHAFVVKVEGGKVVVNG